MARSSVKSSKKPAGGSASQRSESQNNGTDPAKAGGERPSTDTKRKELTPEMREKLAQIRARIETGVGQLVLLMMQLPRYRHQSLGDLNHLIIEPLLRDRVAIAYPTSTDGQKDDDSAPVGAAIWASVSDEVDGKIQEQIRGGAFPVRLSADDWSSGEKIWLLDIIAGNDRAASAVLGNFRRRTAQQGMSIHPAILQRINAKARAKTRQELVEHVRSELA